MSGTPQTSASEPVVPAKAKSFAALRHPHYRIYLITSVLGMMGDNIEHVISYWVLWEKFQSPLMGGVAVLTHWLPFVFFSVYFGGIADRFDNRRVIQVAMLMFMLVSLGWAVLFFADSIEIWQAVLLLTVHGMAGVLWHPATQLLIHDIVGRDNLQSAVRLNASGRNLGILLGPAVGGGLMLLVGPAWGLLINILAYAPALWWLWKAPYGNKVKKQIAAHAEGNAAGVAEPSPIKVAEPRPRLWAGTMGALRQAAEIPVIFQSILLTGLFALFVGNAFQAQMPEFAHDLGNEKAGFSYSMLLGANAAGALVGGLLLETRGMSGASVRVAMMLTGLWCLVIAGFALTDNYPLAVVLMFVAGVLNLAFVSMTQTLVQWHSPAHLRGRMIGLYSFAQNGMRSFSGITIGLLGAVIGIHWSLALSAMALLASTMVLLGFSMRGGHLPGKA